MKRLALLVAGLLIVPALTVAGSDVGEYRDDFGDGGYSGNDGSLDFAGPWQEIGDNGSPAGGLVHIGPENCSNNECLHLEGAATLSGEFGAERKADLSVLTDARLSFDVFADPLQSLVPTIARLNVQAHDGLGWKTIQTYDLKNGFSGSKSFGLEGFHNADFRLRFLVAGAVAGDLPVFLGYVTVDRVVISGALASAPTTSTTVRQPTSTTPPPSTSSTSTTSATSTTSTTSAGKRAASTPETTSTTTTPTESGQMETASSRGPAPSTTTTLPASTTSTTAAALVASLPAPPPGGGLRDSAGGLMADYRPGMMGDMDMGGVDVLGAELTAEFSMAVEVFETARVWVAILALVIAAAIIGGLDRRRARRDPVET